MAAISKDSDRRRAIPAVEKILQHLEPLSLARALAVEIVREELEKIREAAIVPAFEEVLESIRKRIHEVGLTRIQSVINGTGILIHTNLGRSPLGAAVVDALVKAAGDYNNLEFDLNGGERGSRGTCVERTLALLCESEAATVVNNCAAALVLILRHFTAANRKEVIISRGELVQIGGGFRIPEILEASGAELREVGATNKTALADYKKAVSARTAIILKVHQSNFFMGGFVEAPPAEAVAALAHEHGIPFVEDLGSGAIVATERFAGVEHEPTPAEAIRRGVDLVCFSGDKLFGGPQAGIIAGKKELIMALKKNPFFRALRCDKLILSALQATAEIYLRAQTEPEALEQIPILQMLSQGETGLRERAERLAADLKDLPLKISVGTGEGKIGGGTLPKAVVRSVTLDLVPKATSVKELAERLRHGKPAVIGYITGDCLRLDLRTIFPRQDEALEAVLRAAVAESM